LSTLNNATLILFNNNTYTELCKSLIHSLSEIEEFLSSLNEEQDYSQIKKLETIYSDVFNSEIVKQHILFEHSLVPTSLSVRRSWDNLNSENSFSHLNLKLISEEILCLDELYSQRLSRILKFYKNLFSNIDNPSRIVPKGIKEKYQKFLDQLREEINQFLHASSEREIIESREKISAVKLTKFPFPGLYHMTHIDNLEGILKHGLFSHTKAHNEKLIKVDISNQSANSKRARIEEVHHKSLHDYVPLYINPKNAMSYAKRELMKEIIMFEVIPHIAAQTKEILITDGNAASYSTNFYEDLEALNNLKWEVLNAGYWANFEDGKRIRCAEILIPEEIKLTFVQRIVCNNEALIDRICKHFPNRFGIKVELDKSLFY